MERGFSEKTVRKEVLRAGSYQIEKLFEKEDRERNYKNCLLNMIKYFLLNISIPGNVFPKSLDICVLFSHTFDKIFTIVGISRATVPHNCTILGIWVLETFILADEPFTKLDKAWILVYQLIIMFAEK